MSAKRWFIMLICAAFIAVAVVPAVNILVDPFSVFGDILFDWHSYGMTNNPKTAKFAYLDARRGQYDAFVIGPSGAGGFPTAALNEHTGLRWYNMFHYGVDVEYAKNLTRYLIENHDPRHILLILPVVSAESYAPAVTDITFRQPLKPFWRLPFLFADPGFSIRKIEDNGNRTYVQQGFDVFIAETGEYNKSRRDAEAIGNLEDYLISYPEFVDPVFWSSGLNYVEDCVSSVAEIAEICGQSGVELTIAAPPMLLDEITVFSAARALDMYAKVAEISGFWSFIRCPASYDPRFFYDLTHFRNNVGNMMAARMFGSGTRISDDFGVWVTKDNVHSVIGEAFASGAAHDPNLHAVRLPVLTYHHITSDGGADMIISADRFQEHMDALYEAGYTPVSLEQVRDYVILGLDLPQSPVLITFDDGYMSNYTEAYPILRRHGFNAAIFVIGVSHGKDTYKETGYPIVPHFGHAEALEMARSGLISIQSHSFDMHNDERFDDPFRSGVLQLDGESEPQYIDMFRNDHTLMRELLKDVNHVFAFSYPYGKINELSAILLLELGIQMTFSTEPGINTLIRGLPQSLLELKRLNMNDNVTAEDLIRLISVIVY